MLVAAAVFFAVFIHSFVGFGFGLIVTPPLVGLLGLQTAVALVTVIGTVFQFLIVLVYRDMLDMKAVRQLCIGAVPGIPLGMAALHWIDATVLLPVLGMVTVLYAALAANQWGWPISSHPRWAYLFGLGAGGLSGAYNAPGPVIIAYGRGRAWNPGEFKSNLQGFFFFNSLITLAARYLGGELNTNVWRNLGYALPAIVVGILLGSALSRRVSSKGFDKLVLALLALMGLRLLLA